MSDIEDYGYSPYDDIEDILYDADPAPELADDLASHAVHSPVYQDETAAFELQDYFSDWEYYSDDYMDDDPALLNKRTRNESKNGQPLKENGGAKVVKRGRKRKLAETRDKPPLDLSEIGLLTRCIKGTVWAEPAERGPPSYKAGQEGKVALMKDWKELFAITDDGWGRARVDTKVDESWAKDMSLADMGLQNMQGQSFERDTAQENSEYEENEDGDEGEDQDEDAEDQVQEIDDLGFVTDMETEAVDGDELRRKRRRLKPFRQSPPNPEKATADVEDNHVMSTTSSMSQLQEDVAGIILNGTRETSLIKDTQVGTLAKGDRKRKATEEPYDVDTGPLNSTATSRAKRATSTMSKRNQNETTSSRQTRNSSKR